MIKLNRISCPTELANEGQILTAQFISDRSKRVWDKKYIKDPLLAMSNKKCCYCEVDISEESKYMEVEHFECKSVYPHKVVDWENLLPSCKRCNGEKGDYDVISSGRIINPVTMSPKNHLILKENYRFAPKDNIGKSTIQEIHLNETERLVIVRFRIGEAINNAIDIIYRDMEALAAAPSSRKLQKRVTRGLKSLLSEASPRTPFSATAATCIIRSDVYVVMKVELVKLGLWSQELDDAHSVAEEASLL